MIKNPENLNSTALKYKEESKEVETNPSINQQKVKMDQLLEITNNKGFYQKSVFVIMTLLNMIQGTFAYSLFYIFYFPKYICESESGPFECTQKQACAPGQSFSFDKGRD